MMEFLAVIVILVTVGSIIASFIFDFIVASILFVLFFTLAGLFGGASLLHWLADTASDEERLPAILLSIAFTCLCVGTVILGG